MEEYAAQQWLAYLYDECVANVWLLGEESGNGYIVLTDERDCVEDATPIIGPTRQAVIADLVLVVQ